MMPSPILIGGDDYERVSQAGFSTCTRKGIGRQRIHRNGLWLKTTMTKSFVISFLASLSIERTVEWRRSACEGMDKGVIDVAKTRLFEAQFNSYAMTLLSREIHKIDARCKLDDLPRPKAGHHFHLGKRTTHLTLLYRQVELVIWVNRPMPSGFSSW